MEDLILISYETFVLGFILGSDNTAIVIGSWSYAVLRVSTGERRVVEAIVIFE